jgi:hypothetical protein
MLGGVVRRESLTATKLQIGAVQAIAPKPWLFI